jgi:hypothetical protein
VVPSGIRPLPWVARTAWHRLVLPDLQNLHSPHSAVYSGITWSPTASAKSRLRRWPRRCRRLRDREWTGKCLRVVAGQGEGIGVANAGGDDAHQHFAGFGGSTSTSTICRGSLAAKATAARDLMDMAYGERFIVPLVNEFMARHPLLKLEIELTNRTLDMVQEGFDLAIRLGRLNDSSLVATRIAPRAMYLCASPGYLERYGRPHTLSELGQHNCLIGTNDIWTFQQDGREHQFRPSGNWRCNSGQAVLDAAQRGFGLCQLPDYYVLDPLRRGELVSLLEANQPPNAAVWAVYPQRRYSLPKVCLLIDALKAGLALCPEYRVSEDG